MIDFNNMSYVEFISFIKETNRCPGGKDTINWILRNSFVSKDSSILEIGSNTGFSSLEIARLIKCKVYGIDIVPDAVEVANEELNHDISEVKKCVEFSVASAYNIPYSDNSFDLIIAGGSTSFMDNKSKAIQEMKRVLRPWGVLSVTNLYYYTEPPQNLLKKVSDIIGVKITPMNANDWVDIYTNNKNFELYKLEKTRLHSRSESEIDEYIEYFMSKPHISKLSNNEKNDLKCRWKSILMVFNENHQYLGFIKALLRKRYLEEEPELFKLIC